MKICILTPRFPFPENGGDVLRINNIARYLKSKGHQLILISYYTKENVQLQEQLYDKIYYVKLNKAVSCINTMLALLLNKPMMIGYYFSFKYLSVFKNVINIEQPDLYISHLARMVPYLNICSLQDKSIIEMTDAFARTYGLVDVARLSLKKYIYKIEKKHIGKYTQRTFNVYKKCVFVSESDREFFNYNKSIYVYTNGIRCLPDIQTEYDENKIVFVGNMRTLQNQDAVCFFVDNILPLIKKVIPSAVFHVIGADPPAYIKKIADGENIIVSGYVDSVEDKIKNAAVSVAPVRIAAGIQNKVLISMACGVPVVLTPLVSAGIPGLVSNKDCIIAEDKSDFANAVISLMQNNGTRNKISKAGYDKMQAEYSWEQVLNGYEDLPA